MNTIKRKNNSKLTSILVRKIQNLMLYQYHENDDFKDGSYGEVEYEGSKKIRSYMLEKIISELIASVPTEDEETIISESFNLIKAYLISTNFVREQKYLNVRIEELQLFKKRSIEFCSQSYTMFFSNEFKLFCEEYIKSRFLSPTLEKLLVYDLACCEYSSYLDTITIPSWFLIKARTKKYHPLFLRSIYYSKKVIGDIFYIFIRYRLLVFLLDNRDFSIFLALLLYF